LLADNGTRRGARTQEKLVGEILEKLRVRQGTGYKAPDIQALLKKARPVPSYLAAAAQKAQAPSPGVPESNDATSPVAASPEPGTASLPSDAPPAEAEPAPPEPSPEAPEFDAREAEALLRAAELAAEEKALSLPAAPPESAPELAAEEDAPEPAPEPPARAAADAPAKPPRREDPPDASEALTVRPRVGLRGEARHPLAIVLDNDGARRWNGWKDRVGLRKDTDALLLAMDVLRDVVLPWEAEHDADDDALSDEPDTEADANA
jgi:hypothetical protein